MDRIRDLLRNQNGIVNRHQALECGLSDNDLRRLLRKRELRKVHPGVYADHTGPLTWHQRSWAAVLHAWPAALSHESVLRAAQGPGHRNSFDDGPIHVATGPGRTLAQPEGVVLHRTRNLSANVQWNRSPPRLRIEQAALDMAAEARSEFDLVAVLADVVSARLTTADRLIAALADRTRIARRAFLENVLADVQAGTCSVLEHGYLSRIERAHGLPIADRQAIDLSRGTLYRDVLYEEFDQIVELDGRIFHSGSRKRDQDLDRDLEAAVDHLTAVRLGWGQVFDRPCETAANIAAILRARGWNGTMRRCPECSGTLERDRCDLQSPGDSGAHPSPKRPGQTSKRSGKVA